MLSSMVEGTCVYSTGIGSNYNFSNYGTVIAWQLSIAMCVTTPVTGHPLGFPSRGPRTRAYSFEGGPISKTGPLPSD